MSPPRTLLAVGCVLIALGACDRRPSDPPRPTTLLATPAMTLGFAGPPAPAKPPHGPASDPPPSPLPRPPSAPGSGASGVPG